jgi:hypothetical protein
MERLSDRAARVAVVIALTLALPAAALAQMTRGSVAGTVRRRSRRHRDGDARRHQRGADGCH